jgi:poly(3-hydroxybutyrate) depolymerase
MRRASSRLPVIACALAAACQSPATPDDTGGAPPADSGPAPLVEPSGACPDIPGSGDYEITAGGLSRRFTVVAPTAPSGPVGLTFFFHGLMGASGPDPAAYFARSLGLQATADEAGMVFVLPVSGVMSLAAQEFYLWDIALDTTADLTLYDDLRTCVARAFDVDLSRTVAAGFSGGALFTTVIAAQRSDTLAAIVEGSGGADLSVPIWEQTAAAYAPPAQPLPALLITGGEQDVWPDPTFTIVDFVAATDTLQARRAADGLASVRCDHGRGHTLTNAAWDLSLAWITGHRFGAPSPGEDASARGDDADWCALVPASAG